MTKGEAVPDLKTVPRADATEPDRVWFRFMRLHQRMLGQMTARIRALGLSIPQFDLLSTLTEREGISQNELAERLYVTKGNVSGSSTAWSRRVWWSAGPSPGTGAPMRCI